MRNLTVFIVPGVSSHLERRFFFAVYFNAYDQTQYPTFFFSLTETVILVGGADIKVELLEAAYCWPIATF